MSPLEIELAYRAALLAEPTPQPSPYLLESLIRALPRPPAGAPVAWRYAYLQRVIEELCAFAPFNAMEAALATQIIACRYAAADSLRRSLDGSLEPKLAAGMRRVAESLLRAARRTERMVRERPAGRMAATRVPAESVFDLAALDAVWCGHPAGRPVLEDQRENVALPATVRYLPAPASPPDTVAPAKWTLCGQQVDCVRLETITPAGTA
jgi:hypothetical protein